MAENLGRYCVTRLDTNPANTYTVGTWVLVSTFKTEAEAEAYARRAEGPTQHLRVEKMEDRYGRIIP
jgi:hypothetical protein